MQFDSKAGHELRTWILFIVGIGLVIFFAVRETVLNPWWTLIIGVFTSTAVIVSAAQSFLGGMSNGLKRRDSNQDQERRNGGTQDESKRSERRATPIPFVLGYRSRPTLGGFCRSYPDPVF